MAFWSSPEAASPYRQRNFSIQAGDTSQLFWAKSVTKPSFEIAFNEYQIVNQKHKYPGLITWNDITIVLYDREEQAKTLLQHLGTMGFIGAQSYSGQDGISKSMPINPLIIAQYGTDLEKPVQQWRLANAFIKSVNFGQLAYESDDFVEIEITIAYDWAEMDGVDYKPELSSGNTSDPSGTDKANKGTKARAQTTPKSGGKKPGDTPK